MAIAKKIFSSKEDVEKEISELEKEGLLFNIISVQEINGEYLVTINFL